MADEYGDKTEAPTLRRRQEARRQGQVARSADLTAAAVILSALILMQSTGPAMTTALRKLLVANLSITNTTLTSADLVKPIRGVGYVMIPLLIGVVLIALVANVVQVGFLLRARLKPDALNIEKNWERLFSRKTIARLLGHAAKLLVVTLTAYVVVRGSVNHILATAHISPDRLLGTAGALVFSLSIRIAAVLLVLGILAYAYQRHQHERDLRMTRREVADELRQFESHPQHKRRRRELSATLGSARLERDIAAADVLVLHEAQFAVAVRYQHGMPAPTVTAKASGPMVAKLRELAAKHAVPIVDREPLARAMYKLADVDADVPTQLFAAVAEVLAYARMTRSGGVS